MKLRIRKIAQGPGPNEYTIAVSTSAGSSEQVVIDESSLAGSYIEIGAPLGKKERSCLIELPRESVKGSWRLWVPEDDLSLQAGT